MDKLALIIAIITMPFVTGFLDGWWKRKGSANHDVKWIFWVAIIALSYFKVEIYPLITMVVMIKPLHDLGYTIGRGRGAVLEMSKTNIDDKPLIWLFRIKDTYKSSSVRMVAWLYYAVIFFGTCVLTYLL